MCEEIVYGVCLLGSLLRTETVRRAVLLSSVLFAAPVFIRALVRLRSWTSTSRVTWGALWLLVEPLTSFLLEIQCGLLFAAFGPLPSLIARTLTEIVGPLAACSAKQMGLTLRLVAGGLLVVDLLVLTDVAARAVLRQLG